MAKSKNRDSKPPRVEPPPSPRIPQALASLEAARPSALSLFLRWIFSGNIRHASAMHKHVQKLINHQRDILSLQAIDAVRTALRELQNAIESGAEKEALEKQMENLENAANKWLKPYPHAAWRENVEVLLVALSVAMAIRTFFLQPFKIPTGSMQPTLFGVTSENLANRPDFHRPTGWERVRQWFAGVSYLHEVADSDGTLDHVDQPFRLLIFNIYQTFEQGGKTYILWFPPDYGEQRLEQRAQIHLGQFFHKGEDILNLKVVAGDHLFVDRLTYNFRPPERGEIIVFATKGIPEERRETSWWHIPADQFYIKRLVGLGGERIQLGADRHLIIDGKRLDASTPHFEKVYSFNPNEPPRESHYSGHVDLPGLAPFFANKPDGVLIPKSDYMVMGDNTMNSLDSRAWGTFPSQYVIGRSFFVYWPITDRFGWGYHR
jgi:signal peptidase I